MRPHVVDHLPVDTLGGVAQRQFAESGEVAGRKEIVDGAAGLFRNVDLTFAEAFDQVVGRQVDQFDFVGGREHVVRYGLAHLDAGDLFDDVV